MYFVDPAPILAVLRQLPKLHLYRVSPADLAGVLQAIPTRSPCLAIRWPDSLGMPSYELYTTARLVGRRPDELLGAQAAARVAPMLAARRSHEVTWRPGRMADGSVTIRGVPPDGGLLYL